MELVLRSYVRVNTEYTAPLDVLSNRTLEGLQSVLQGRSLEDMKHYVNERPIQSGCFGVASNERANSDGDDGGGPGRKSGPLMMQLIDIQLSSS